MSATTPIAVEQVAFVSVPVADLERSTAFYTEHWGLGLGSDDGSRRYFRSSDPRGHSLVIEPGEGEVESVAFAVGSVDELERAERVLAEHGVEVVLPPTDEVEPGVGRSLHFLDPAGLLVRLVTEVEPTAAADHVGAAPLGLDHVVLRVPDYERSKRFYLDVLGFRLSDQTHNVMAFLRCNPNHHSLALMRGDSLGLNHAAFTVADWDALARGIKDLGDAGVPRVWGPGRHGPGNNLFSYFTDPDGHTLEYTCEVEQILDDEAWEPRTFPLGRPDRWGSQIPPEMR